MSREFTVIIEQDEEEYYVATVPQLHGCHTQARSPDELMVRVKEAIELCLRVTVSPFVRADRGGDCHGGGTVAERCCLTPSPDRDTM